MLPFGKGAYVTRGERCTVVTWGATVHRAQAAAKALAADSGVDAGIDAGIEIIDLRTIVPWDHDIVAESVRKTGRVLVLHEDTLTCGFGAEIAAFVADECFEYLDAPVWRLAATDTFVAYEPELENAILPQIADIERDLRALLAY
jgi:2-oxoisovalerate dehydrogenase E1 component